MEKIAAFMFFEWLADSSWKCLSLLVVHWFPKSVSRSTSLWRLTKRGLNEISPPPKKKQYLRNQSTRPLRLVTARRSYLRCVSALRLWESTAVWRKRQTCCCPLCRPCRRRLNIWSTTWAPRLASNWTCSPLWETHAGSWRLLKVPALFPSCAFSPCANFIFNVCVCLFLGPCLCHCGREVYSSLNWSNKLIFCHNARQILQHNFPHE